MKPVLRLIAGSLAGLVSAVILLLASGAFRNPSASLHGMLGSALWTTLGPHFLLLSLLAAGLSSCKPWRKPVLWVPAWLALALSAWICIQIVSATRQAGGEIRLLDSLFLSAMTGAEPDLIEAVVAEADLELNIAIFRPEAAARPVPLLVYIHGGGFQTGSFLETAADLRWFADQGWLVFSVEYRLWTAERPTWEKAPADAARALAWVQLHAARLGGDMRRMALLGDSAGGNLAVNLAFSAAAGTAESPCGNPVPVPAAVVVQYPAADPLAIYGHGFPVRGFEPEWLITGYLGGSPFDFPGRVAAVSSYSFLTPAAPPTLILSPEKDGLVPAWSVARFADYARLAGAPVTRISLPFANHVYNQLAFQSLGNQTRRSLTRNFLSDQGLAP